MTDPVHVVYASAGRHPVDRDYWLELHPTAQAAWRAAARINRDPEADAVVATLSEYGQRADL